MTPSTQNEIEGKVHEVKGEIKETVGHLTNNPDLEDQGTVEKITGKIQKKIDQVEKVIEKR
ncbi:MAG: CsbD family protein [Candidatus Acidiferrum sp.]|jgi:uncharacterized protein YjbJ (UPF0337 family)